MRTGKRVVFDEERTCIEDKVTEEKIWATDDDGIFMVKMYAFKFDEEDPRPEGRSAGEEGEQAGREDEGEEGRRAKGMTVLMKVSHKGREEHELAHTQFRAGCPYCMRARGRNTSHLKNQDINKTSPKRYRE